MLQHASATDSFPTIREANRDARQIRQAKSTQKSRRLSSTADMEYKAISSTVDEIAT